MTLRLSSKLLFFVLGCVFAAGCTTRSTVAPDPSRQKDIVAPGNGVRLGPGWYPFETFGGQTFRWVDNDAQLTVCPDLGHRAVKIELEPGPSLGTQEGRSMSMTVRSLSEEPKTISVPDRRVITLDLKSAAPQTLTLHVESRNLPVRGEKRILNFRIFAIALGSRNSCDGDVVRDDSPLKLGKSWYPLEKTPSGETFRWINEDAQLIATHAVASNELLQADVEAGPSAGKSALLSVKENGRLLVQEPMPKSRAYVTIAVPGPVAAGTVFAFEVRGSGTSVPKDPRILNARFFDVRLRPAV